VIFIYLFVFFINNVVAVWVGSPSYDPEVEDKDIANDVTYKIVGKLFGLRCTDKDGKYICPDFKSKT